MTHIQPFKALYYNTKKNRNLKDCFVPPYDVISEEEKKKYFKKSPYNYARVILGKSKRDGYLTASHRFWQWQKKEVLIEDVTLCFYLWEQKFYHGGKVKKRKAMVTAVSLEDFKKGNILPHEKTLDAPKSDRLEILKACQANLSPVFMMVQDSKNFLENEIFNHCKIPFIHMRDDHGIWNTLWRMDDEKLQKKIKDFFAKKKLYIVDGHHRFATALNYQKSSRGEGEGSQDFVLAAITNMHDSSLVIDPIYRILPHAVFFDKENYLKKLEKNFVIRKRTKISKLKKYHWGIIFQKDPLFYELWMRNPKSLLSQVQGAQCVKKLDVSILEQKIIPALYRKHIEYVRGYGDELKKALKDVQKGKIAAIWFVKEASVLQVKEVADHHKIMPPKSTYFYPKILSGPIIRKL